MQEFKIEVRIRLHDQEFTIFPQELLINDHISGEMAGGECFRFPMQLIKKVEVTAVVVNTEEKPQQQQTPSSVGRKLMGN